MKVGRTRRFLLIGLGLSAVSLVGGRSIWLDPAPMEEPPMESILEAEVAPVVEVAPAWDLPAERNDKVDFWIDFLAGRNYDKTRLWLERSGRYAPFIRQELRARGMPEDLIYFAMIESGFSNRAHSRASAVGMWQFIAETGRRYGLDVTPYVDERRDPVRATRAALTYLQEMYDDFGSWYLAAAGYNSGENRVARILREEMGGARGSEELYWRISDHLPRETRDYVPLMLAAAHIAKAPDAYGFAELEYQESLSYEEVTVPGATPLSVVAQAAGADEEEVRELNPHLVRGMTPPGRDYPVRVPQGHRERFVRDFAQVEEQVRLAALDHRVARGETLSHIALRYGVSVAELRSANHGLDPRRIRAGQVLTVPSRVAMAGGGPVASETRDTGWSTYQVRRGDTLWEIARRHRVTVTDLRNWNDLGRASRIQPGQSLRIRA